MENKIKEAFGSVQMSPSCEKKIVARFRRRPKIRPWIRCVTAASVILLLVVLLLQDPNVVKALEDTFDAIVDNISVLNYGKNHNGEYVITPEHFGITKTTADEQETISEEAPANTNSNLSSKDYLTEEIPPWLDPADDGLYFIADGQRTEIGSKITEETPFTYVFTSYDNLIFYIVIGGTYVDGDTNLEGVGWAFWYQDGNVAQKDPGLAWIGGGARNAFHNGIGRPWYQAGKKALGVPFP